MFSFLKNIGQPKQSLAEALKKDHALIDVRTTSEYANGSAKNAINIPLDILPVKLAEIPKDKTVIVFCQSGGRSAMAAQTLKANGYTDVINGGGVAAVQRAQATL